MSYEEVQSAICDVILFDTPKGKSSHMIRHDIPYPVGTRFYRVRTLSENDSVLPLKGMSKVSDCWEPPKNIVKAGRLNKGGESLLYTAPNDSYVAVQEMGIEDNQLFALIVYEATENITATIIGSTANIAELTEDESIKSKMLDRFFKHEFSRDVGAGAEYLYRISESITKTYFNLPIQDAWQYPSTKNNGSHNVCFHKEGSSKLKLIGTIITTKIQDGKRILFKPEVFAIASSDEIDLTYHEIGSEIYKDLFPEFEYTESKYHKENKGTSKNS
jgi:hypothetical protein